MRITVFVMTMALIRMKYGCKGISFIRQDMVFLVIDERLRKDLTLNRTRWIITQSKCFKGKGIKKITTSVRASVYLVLTSQVQAISSIVDY